MNKCFLWSYNEIYCSQHRLLDSRDIQLRIEIVIFIESYEEAD